MPNELDVKKVASAEMLDENEIQILNKIEIALLLTGELSSYEQFEVLLRIFNRMHKYSTEYKMCGDDFSSVAMFYYDNNLDGIYKPDPIVTRYLEETFGDHV